VIFGLGLFTISLTTARFITMLQTDGLSIYICKARLMPSPLPLNHGMTSTAPGKKEERGGREM